MMNPMDTPGVLGAGGAADSNAVGLRGGSDESTHFERMPTGIPGLDHLLDGGFVRGNSMLIEGPPGSGKSSLAMRILYEGIAQYNEPGLMITFEEFPRQLYLEAMQFGIDLKPLEAAGMLRVVWTPPARILKSFTGKIDLIDKIIGEIGPRRLVIDSITHFRRVATDEQALREVLGQILNALKIRGITSILVKELDRINDEAIAFEEYLVDASIRLHNVVSPTGGENIRQIEVRKTRGQPHVSGRHPFRLTTEGVVVYPRLRPADVKKMFVDVAKPQRKRISTGIPGVDDMLRGGLWNGSLNLVAGQPGTGKSVVAHYFLDEGLRAGETVLLLSMKNTPEEILAQTSYLGLHWEEAYRAGRLRIHYHDPVSLLVEQVMDELVRDIRRTHPCRLVLDSIDDLWTAVKDEDRVRDYVLMLAALFQAAGTTSILLNEIRGSADVDGGDARDYSYIASTVVRLTNTNTGEEMQRQLRVTKHTASDHSGRVAEYLIDHEGFRILDGGTCVLPASPAAGVAGPAPAPNPAVAEPAPAPKPAMTAPSAPAPVVEPIPAPPFTRVTNAWVPDKMPEPPPLQTFGPESGLQQIPAAAPGSDARPRSEGWVSPFKRHRDSAWTPETPLRTPNVAASPRVSSDVPASTVTTSSSSGSELR